MSNLMYNGRLQAVHTLFTSARLVNGSLANRQGKLFSGEFGFVLIGPDISLPGGITINPPVAEGAIWRSSAGGVPAVTFVNDTNYAWVRGHLVNGEWGGPGNAWQNLTPLTPTANHNHATIENYMRAFCQASLNYDTSTNAYKPDWYAIAYLVQCSVNPWAASPTSVDLYSYAPEFIKVSWRAVRIPKPDNVPPSSIAAYLNTQAPLPAPALPFLPPPRPTAISGRCVPAGNAPGGSVYAGVGLPPAQTNGFDGEVEIHQG